MRFYLDFPEAFNEIKRDVKEMGIRVKTKSVQNLDITNRPEYETLELQNYVYTVTQPDYDHISLNNKEWCEEEFKERTSGLLLNPGYAWKLREEYWKQFLVGGKFDYTYPQRMRYLNGVIEALKKDPYSRRAFLSVFDRYEDHPEDFNVRVPCTLGYWFNFRKEMLNITYLQRSSDFSEHFNNDVYLADRLKHYVAAKVNLMPGTFTHWIGSLHIFQRDVENVF